MIYVFRTMMGGYEDQHHANWTSIRQDEFAGESTISCSEPDCPNQDLTSGWLCLDNGREACDEHVTICSEFIVQKLQLEFQEAVSMKNSVVFAFLHVKMAAEDLFA